MSILIKNNNLECTDYKNIKFDTIDNFIGDVIINNKVNKNILTRFIGIIHFDSPHTKSSSKKNYIYKKCSIFFNYFQDIWILTNKFKENKNMYAILKINWDKTNNLIFASVEEYIGYVSNFEIEQKVIYLLSTCHWSKKIDRILLGKDKKKIDLDFDIVKKRNIINDNIYSIDPNGCEDIDDALQYNFIDNKHYVRIHIADVTSFFENDSFIWDEMKNRVESIYLNEKQIYMFPKEYTINYLSLKNDNKCKRSMTCVIIFDLNFNIEKYYFERNLIKIINLSYDEANKMIDENKNNDLLMLNKIAKTNYKKLVKNDNLYLDSHQLVEYFMILANNKVAEYISKHDENCLLRVQEKKDINNYKIKNKYSNKLNLLQMNRAEYKYKSDNNTHNGLNLDLYTHFTSPIRRYADCLVHQCINNIELNNKKEISIEKVFNLNHYHSHYKKCLIYENEINLVTEIIQQKDKSFIDLECVILFFNKNRCRVMTLDEKYIFDINILNEKIENSSNVEIINNSNEQVTIIYNDKKIILSILDKIITRICYIPHDLKKIKGYIQKPNLSFNL